MELSAIDNIGTGATKVLKNFHKLKQIVKDELTPITYSQSELYKLLKYTDRPIAANTLAKEMITMAEQGYEFKRTHANSYILNRDDCIAVADFIGVKKYRAETDGKAYIVQIQNLKGGVGKSMGTNMLATALVHMPRYLLKDIRVLIVDLDPQSTSTQHNAPENAINEGTYTSIALMCDDADKAEIDQHGIIKNVAHNIDIIPCSTGDGFYADDLDLPETRGNYKYQELLLKRIIEKYETDYDFILLDAGPHMDKVMKNCLWAVNGVYIPVPTTFYDFDSTLNFLSRLPIVMKQLVEDGMDLSKLDFVKPYISKSSNSENQQDKEVYENASIDLAEIFGHENTIKNDLPEEDVYERCAENGGTVFTIKPKDYPGSSAPFKRAKSAAEKWANELITGMMTHHKKRGSN
ncbi:AAA family ATPase [Vibrio sp. Y2-5]|uniref:ParA family protein n=1 Tax=Vibrio sp. Y2-5 TaxID=2743977 RepID=UPI00166093D7|nr:ParA family protein [Vibrio sp. Y2-5]MBD0788235.1 AAA family ATPase [Vibrio sp. Y2-5]